MNDFMLGASHTKLSIEEYERLLRLLSWIDSACRNSDDDKELLRRISYKLRAQLKEEKSQL